jgi:uncharacterized protein (DUF58 family)
MKNGTTVSLPELIALRFQAQTIALSKHRRKVGSKFSRAGENSAIAFGRGLEFAEVREYQAGDDIRTMDWRVTARTGKPHTKLYQEERERSLFLAVDYCQDMFFGTRVAFKSVIAARAAALIAWVAMEGHHRIGSLLFSDDQRVETRPKIGQQGVLPLLKRLAEMSEQPAKSSQSQALSQALVRLNRVATPGSTVVLISDCSGLDKVAENHLCQLASHCQVMIVFVYDPVEKNLPEDQSYAFTNGEQFTALDCSDLTLQKNYTEQFCEREAYFRKQSLQLGISFIALATNDSMVDVLSRGLSGILK